MNKALQSRFLVGSVLWETVRVFISLSVQLAVMLIGILMLVYGTMISAVFIEFADYRWIFFFTTLIAIPSAIVCMFLIPSQDTGSEDVKSEVISRVENLRKLDLVGVTGLTGTSSTMFFKC